MAQVWQRLRECVHRYDAGISLWDGVTAPHDGPARVVIKGFGGELYRTHQTIDDGRPPRRSGWLQLLRFEQRQNPLGIVRADVAAGHADWLSDFARDARRRTRPDLVPDLLRAVYVQGHWNGLMGQCTPGLVQVNPLLTPVGVAANARLNGPARHRERLHHEVMRRLAPELVEIPFYGSRWRPSLRRQAELTAAGRRATPGRRLAFEVLVAKDRLRNFERLAALTPGMQKPVRLLQKRRRSWGPPDKALLTWQWRFLASEGDAIVALCERAGRDGGLAELCDMDRLLALTRTSASIAEPIEARSVLTAVTTSLALLGEHQRATDHIWP